MKVVTESVPVIKFVPRIYPVPEDTIIITFEDSLVIPFSWVVEKNIVIITLDNTNLVQRGNYSFSVLIGAEIIYKGKIIFLKDGTDVQNYTNQSQDNKRWQ